MFQVRFEDLRKSVVNPSSPESVLAHTKQVRLYVEKILSKVDKRLPAFISVEDNFSSGDSIGRVLENISLPEDLSKPGKNNTFMTAPNEIIASAYANHDVTGFYGGDPSIILEMVRQLKQMHVSIILILDMHIKEEMIDPRKMTSEEYDAFNLITLISDIHDINPYIDPIILTGDKDNAEVILQTARRDFGLTLSVRSKTSFKEEGGIVELVRNALILQGKKMLGREI